jgi:hypothetical protein
VKGAIPVFLIRLKLFDRLIFCTDLLALRKPDALNEQQLNTLKTLLTECSIKTAVKLTVELTGLRKKKAKIIGECQRLSETFSLL